MSWFLLYVSARAPRNCGRSRSNSVQKKKKRVFGEFSFRSARDDGSGNALFLVSTKSANASRAGKRARRVFTDRGRAARGRRK